MKHANAVLAAIAFLAAAIVAQPASRAAAEETIMLAGGCFWCVEADFDTVDGVVETVSGFTGGTTENPTYKQVSAGGTGHREVVRVTFDPDRLPLERLLDIYWHSIDPTDDGGQFCDRGTSYQSVVYVADERQREIALRTMAAAEGELGKAVVTPVIDAGPFYAADDGHQDYAERHGLRYAYFRWRCGRDARVREIWGDEAHRGLAGN